jgi:hypothetical protein
MCQLTLLLVCKLDLLSNYRHRQILAACPSSSKPVTKCKLKLTILQKTMKNAHYIKVYWIVCQLPFYGLPQKVKRMPSANLHWVHFSNPLFYFLKGYHLSRLLSTVGIHVTLWQGYVQTDCQQSHMCLYS